MNEIHQALIRYITARFNIYYWKKCVNFSQNRVLNFVESQINRGLTIDEQEQLSAELRRWESLGITEVNCGYSYSSSWFIYRTAFEDMFNNY